MESQTEIIEENHEENTTPTKKSRLFSGKEFRQTLATSTAYESIKKFVQLCAEENPAQDYALEFLEAGGNVSEFSRIIELSDVKNASYVMPIFEACNYTLLKITSSYPQKQTNAEESCREILNKHYSAIKSLLMLNTSNKQKKVALKLLTTMVTLSPSVAKEVLGHTVFDRAILEIVTQPSNLEDGSSIRTAFIHFLLAFLVDNNSATILTFLEKRHLLDSIFHGLLYDTPELINLVLSVIQSNVLKNPSVKKTLKMHIFNTQVVKNLFNLYNWRGPKNWHGKIQRNKTEVINVDKEKKMIVSECIHQFLLILCTTKFGIIFQDPFMGLSTKNYNPILDTVIESLAKPWNNPFVRELIVKICSACPDLVKKVLKIVEPFLEPRVSPNYIIVLQFIKQLIENLSPKYVVQFFSQLSIKQIVSIIISFCVPKSVVNKVVSVIIINHEHIGMRHESISLLNTMLKSVDNYLTALKDLPMLPFENKVTIQNVINNYLTENLPASSAIIKAIQTSISTDAMHDPVITIPDLNDHLNEILNVLCLYHSVNPQLISNLTKELNINDFIRKIENQCSDSNFNDMQIEIQMKAINLLLLSDPYLFEPSTDVFGYSFPLLLKLYFISKYPVRSKIESIICNILKVSSIFEGCNDEIFIWLYSILELDDFSDKICNLLVQAIQKTSANFLKYVAILNTLKKVIMNDYKLDVQVMIQNLDSDDYENNLLIEHKHTLLSPMVIGFLELLLEIKYSKMKTYINIVLINLLHNQTDITLMTNLISNERFSKVIDKNIVNYYNYWSDCSKSVSLTNIYVSSSLVCEINTLLSNGLYNFKSILNVSNESEWKTYYCFLLTKTIMFYFTQYTLHKILTEEQQKSCLEVIIFILDRCINNNMFKNCLDCILKHPVLTKSFTPISDEKHSENQTSDFVSSIVKHLLEKKYKLEIDEYITGYKIKLVTSLLSFLQHYEKSKASNLKKLMILIQLFEPSHEQNEEILQLIVDLPTNCYFSDNKQSVVLDILNYLLISISNTNIPISSEKIAKIFKLLYNLSNIKPEINLENFETSLCTYLNKFPHNIENVDKKLFNRLLTKTSINKSTINLISLILKSNQIYLNILVAEIDKVLDKRELIFPLLNSVISKNSVKVKLLCTKVYNEHEQLILKFINKPQKSSNYLINSYKVITKLVNDCMNIETCNSFSSKSHKFDITEIYHAEVIHKIFNKSIQSQDSNEERIKYVTNYINTFMNMLVYLLKKVEKTDDDWHKIQHVTELFCAGITEINDTYKIKYENEKLYNSSVFQNFSKLCLKFGLQDKPILINLIKYVCKITNTTNPNLEILFEMAMSHSEFLNIVLSENDVKAPLLNFLLVLCQKCPNVVIKSHIPIWLGAFEGTMKPSDQYLIELLRFYDKADVGFQDFRPYLWGKAAVARYSIKHSIDMKLWRQPGTQEVLELFDEKRIEKTITNYPIKRTLLSSESMFSGNVTDVYDPAFYLPLLSSLLATESKIVWYGCLRRGIISLAFISLSSRDKEIRSASCLVLARFYNLILIEARQRRANFWLHLIESVCRGVSALKSLKLSSIVAIFIARCILVFTRPNNPLYSTLANYFMAKECPDFTVVPDFLTLLFSTDVNNTLHQNFILTVIRDGLQTDHDLNVLYKSVTLKMIMDLYNSHLAERKSQILILEILAAAALLSNGARNLVSNNSLISWLHGILNQMTSNDSDLLTVFLNILNNLIQTYSADFIHIQFNILSLLLSTIDVIKKLQINLNDLQIFVKLLFKTYDLNPIIMTKTNLNDLLEICTKFVDCNVCNYYLEYGSKFIDAPVLESDDINNQVCYNLKLLTLKWIFANKC